MNEVEMGMNRRSWTALMEFAGLLGEDEHPSMSRNTSRLRERDTSNSNSASERELRRSEREDYTDVQPSGEPFILACGLHIRTLRINMNYPANGTRLGVVSFQNIDILNSVRLGDVGDQMSLSLCFDGMRVTDRTPLYSTLYDDRVVLTDDTSLVPARAQLTLVKYLGDVDLSREWDLLVQMTVPSAMHMYYVHTHRYFCGLMDFWMQFFELQDQVTKQKKLNAFDGPRSRVKLDIEIQSPTTIVFPLNQLSDQCLVLESSGLRVTNSFKKHSSLSNVFKTNSVDKGFGFDNKIDCLIDCMRAMLSDVQLHEARRIDRVLRREEKGTASLGRNVFDNFEFHVSKEDIFDFDKRFDLATDVYRNLDGHLSHNAPDITIIAGVRNLSWRVTTDFYCLLRGASMATVCVRQRSEVGSSNKYATLSLRIIFEDVSLDCQVPAQVVTSTGVFFDSSCSRKGHKCLLQCAVSAGVPMSRRKRAYDRTLRIFSTEGSNAREIYHTKRMVEVLSVAWSMDNKFVISGSNEMNIHVWKAKAAEKIGPKTAREEAALEYSEKLRENYKEHPEISRIQKHRHLPKGLKSLTRGHLVQKNSERKKDLKRLQIHEINPDRYYVPKPEKERHMAKSSD